MPTIAHDMNLLSLDLFDAAFAMTPGSEDEVKRRFMTLFVETGGRRGGSAEVCRATNAFGETFAVKQLRAARHSGSQATPSGPKVLHRSIAGTGSPSAATTPSYVTSGDIAAFYEEYRIHRGVSHLRGFPRLYGFGLAEGSPVIVMEWVEGVTLRDALREAGISKETLLPLATVVELGLSVVGLLQRAGELDEGFVHRDLSPRNIMLRTDRTGAAEQLAQAAFDLCLVDFGSATLRAAASDDPTFTERTDVWRMGTPAYAPPEMLSADVTPPPGWRSSPAIDVYALCSVLFELYGGRRPFDVGPQDPRSPFVIKTQTAPRELVPREPDGGMLAATIAAGLALRQEDRPTTAALRNAFENWRELPGQRPRGTHGATPVDAGFWEPCHARRTLTRRALISGGIVGLAAFASAALVFRRSLTDARRQVDPSSYRRTNDIWAGKPLFRAYDGDLGSWALCTRDGQIACKVESSRACGALRGGVAALFDDISASWGYIVPADDAEYAWKLTPQFARAGDFSEGFAAIIPTGSRHWGYVDLEGGVAIPARYGEAGAFSQGAAAVRDSAGSRLWGAIDTSGSWLIEPRFATLGTRSEEGLAVAEDADAPGSWGIVDADGAWTCEERFALMRRLSCGCAPALDEASGLWGFVSPDGSWRVPPAYLDARPFSDAHDEGVPLAAVQNPRTKLWLFVEADGAPHDAMEPTFWKLGDLWDGLAPAQASIDDDTVVFDESEPDVFAEAAGRRYGYVDGQGAWQMRRLTELLDTAIGPAGL